MSGKPKLTYWKGRGRAEAIRLTLVACGIEWEHPMFMTEPEQMAKLRATPGLLKFGQLPLLEIDGMNLVQTGAITRHLARTHGLFGANDKEAYTIDMLTEGARDLYAPFMVKCLVDDEKFAKDTKTAIDKYMPIFEKEIGDHDFLVGGKLSLADVALLEALLATEESHPSEFNTYPNLKRYYHNLKGCDKFAKYLAGDQRYPANTPAYIDVVKKTLGW